MLSLSHESPIFQAPVATVNNAHYAYLSMPAAIWPAAHSPWLLVPENYYSSQTPKRISNKTNERRRRNF
jgi:hypothetical protein